MTVQLFDWRQRGGDLLNDDNDNTSAVVKCIRRHSTNVAG